MPKTLAADTFTRANQSGFGTSSDGETWTETGAGTLSIASNAGVIVSTGSDTNVQLGTNTSATQEVVCLISFGNTNDIGGVQARYSVSGGNVTCYKFLFYSGAVHINKSVAGTNTNLVNLTAALTINTTYWFKLRCIGTGLYAKYWASSGGEPSSWSLTTTDSSASSGGFGILANTNAGSSGFKFSSFTATDALNQNDASGRARIAAQVLKNTSGRSRIAAQTLRDIAGRLRSAATISKDIALRFRLSTGTIHTLDLASRLPLLAVSIRTLTSRARLLASATWDIGAARTRIAILRTQDITSRNKLLAIRAQDSATRSRIAALRAQDSAARSRIAAIRAQDIGIVRTKIAAQVFKNASVRSKIAALLARDLSWRIILKPLHLWNLSTRFPLQVFQTKDTGARFNIFVSGGNTFTTNPNTTIFGLGFAGSTVLTPTPVGIYAVNGTLLPDTPTLATAPPLQSGTVQVGATFLLLFSSPSGTTTSLLANGSLATLTFPLASGDQVSTKVLIKSTSGSMFQVICTVTAPVAVNRYVIITQFF